MNDYKLLEELISSHIKSYEDGFNTINDKNEVRFNLTLTNHKVEVEGKKHDVAYLRLERMIRPKGGTDDEWESLLLYSQAYKFLNMQERVNPEAPWKFELYSDLLGRLISGGLEYGEVLKKLQQIAKNNQGKPISNIITPDEPSIIITNKMPEPLTPQEQEYKQWVDRNNINKQ